MKNKLLNFVFAFICIITCGVLLSACGGTNDNEPDDITVSYNIIQNGNLYTIESNNPSDGFRISVQNGSTLSVSDVLFEIYANGTPVTAQDYQITSNIPSTALEYGQEYHITYSYGEESATIFVTVSEFEIDLSSINSLQFSYSEIDSGESEYIDIIEKIDEAMQKAGLSYTLSSLKSQDAIVIQPEYTMEQPSDDLQVTRTYHANTLDGNEYMSYYFEIDTNAGYTIKDNIGTKNPTKIVYWQVLPVMIETPTATNLDTLVFNPSKLQAPTLVFGTNNEENTKFNNIIEITNQFKAGYYYQIEYTIKDEFKRNYKLLNQWQQIADTVQLDQNWRISPLTIPKATLLFHNADYYVYDGNEKRPGWVLPQGYGYLFTNPSYSNNVEVGTARMTVELTNNWGFSVNGQNYYLSDDDLYNCFTWQSGNGEPISSYYIEFEITKAEYALPSSITNKTIELTYGEIENKTALLECLNQQPSYAFNSETYQEWSSNELLNYGYEFSASEGNTTSINTRLRTIGSHTITLLYTPSAEHYLNTVEVVFNLIISKKQIDVYDISWSNVSYEYNYYYTYDGTEKSAPTCSVNYIEKENSITYVAVENNGTWVADKTQPVTHPTNAGKYITVVNLERNYEEYIYDGGSITELSSPVWEIKQQRLSKFHYDDEPEYCYYLGSYNQTNIESYTYEDKYYYGSYATGSNIIVDYNESIKTSILHYDYFITTTNASGYAISYEKWNNVDNEWQATTNTAEIGKYRVCFTFDLDPNYIFIDYGTSEYDFTLTNKQYFEFEIYPVEYDIDSLALNNQTAYQYTGNIQTSSPRVVDLPHGLVAQYEYYASTDTNNDNCLTEYEATEIGSYKVIVAVKASEELENHENVQFVKNQGGNNPECYSEAQISPASYSVVKREINKNDISVHNISDYSAFYDDMYLYFDLPDNATYSKYVFSSTVVIKDDNNIDVSTNQYFEPFTHYTMTITLKLFASYSDFYTLVGANENDEFVYSFDWTTDKFTFGIQKDINFSLNYDETSDSLPSITDISYLGGLPKSVTNWQDVLDVRIVNSVWDNEEEYQQGGGTTKVLDDGTPTESGRHYICEAIFSIKDEYKSLYELIEYMTYIQISWTKP